MVLGGACLGHVLFTIEACREDMALGPCCVMLASDGDGTLPVIG